MASDMRPEGRMDPAGVLRRQAVDMGTSVFRVRALDSYVSKGPAAAADYRSQDLFLEGVDWALRHCEPDADEWRAVSALLRGMGVRMGRRDLSLALRLLSERRLSPEPGDGDDDE